MARKKEEKRQPFILTIEGHDLGNLTPEEHKKQTIKKLIAIAYDHYLLTQKRKANDKRS